MNKAYIEALEKDEVFMRKFRALIIQDLLDDTTVHNVLTVDELVSYSAQTGVIKLSDYLKLQLIQDPIEYMTTLKQMMKENE